MTKAERIDRYVQDYGARDLAQLVVEMEDDAETDVVRIKHAAYEHAARQVELMSNVGLRRDPSPAYSVARRIRALKDGQ